MVYKYNVCTYLTANADSLRIAISSSSSPEKAVDSARSMIHFNPFCFKTEDIASKSLYP